MSVLVTGATGFIGSHVVTALLKQGHQVIATSRNIEKARHSEWFDQVEYIPFDVNDPTDNIYEIFHKPDSVIHMAWEGLPGYKDLFHYERNLLANYHFLKILLQSGVKNLTVAGSSLEYGLQNGCLTEDMPTRPVTAYGLAKDTLRKFLEQYQKQYPFSLKWARIFYLYGKGQSEKSLLSLLDKAVQSGETIFNMSGGEQLRDYLPVSRVAECIAIVAMQNKYEGIINCCSGQPVSIRNLVEDFLSKRQKKIQLNLGFYPYPDYEPMAFWGDTKKLERILTDFQT